MTTDELLQAIRDEARIPVASSLGADDASLIARCNRELDRYIVPLVLKQVEDHWLNYIDIPVTPTATYRIPSRAIGSKLREVSYLDAQGLIYDPPRRSVDDLEGRQSGFYLRANEVCFPPGTQMPYAVRLWFNLRPNHLVPLAQVGVIANFDRSANTVDLESVPAGFTGKTAFDIVRAVPGYETLAFALYGADSALPAYLPASLSGSTLAFSGGLPADLQIGDYITLPEQAPVPQIPYELHSLLAQRVAVKWLEVNDPDGYEAANAELQRMEAAAPLLLAPRVDGELQAITRANPLWD